MKKGLSHQLELFTPEGAGRAQPQVADSILTRIRTYEKLILLLISFFITGIASFCLGVKKGHNEYKDAPGAHHAVVKETPLRAQKQEPAYPQTKQEKTYKEEAVKPVKNPEQSGYTIQVASFSNRENARKESENLKRKGLSPLVLPKGKFNIVCVGNFSKIQDAEFLLPKLKKQYADCRIRRL